MLEREHGLCFRLYTFSSKIVVTIPLSVDWRRQIVFELLQPLDVDLLIRGFRQEFRGYLGFRVGTAAGPSNDDLYELVAHDDVSKVRSSVDHSRKPLTYGAARVLDNPIPLGAAENTHMHHEPNHFSMLNNCYIVRFSNMVSFRK